jgi:hypothetical protein
VRGPCEARGRRSRLKDRPTTGLHVFGLRMLDAHHVGVEPGTQHRLDDTRVVLIGVQYGQLRPGLVALASSVHQPVGAKRSVSVTQRRIIS